MKVLVKEVACTHTEWQSGWAQTRMGIGEQAMAVHHPANHCLKCPRSVTARTAACLGTRYVSSTFMM